MVKEKNERIHVKAARDRANAGWNRKAARPMIMDKGNAHIRRIPFSYLFGVDSSIFMRMYALITVPALSEEAPLAFMS